MGVTLVRSELERGKISPAFVHPTSVWLSAKDKEAEERRGASNSAQIELARRASEAAERAAAAADRSAAASDRSADAAERQATAAERANIKANIAMAIAIVSAIVAGIGIWMTHLDAHK